MKAAKASFVSFIVIVGLGWLLAGCSALDNYDRTYAVEFQDGRGGSLKTGVTLHPRTPLPKTPDKQLATKVP
jgi:hypothetical protein